MEPSSPAMKINTIARPIKGLSRIIESPYMRAAMNACIKNHVETKVWGLVPAGYMATSTRNTPAMDKYDPEITEVLLLEDIIIFIDRNSINIAETTRPVL